MGAVEQSYARVESHLAAIGEEYDSFSINQTTLAVSSSRYEQELDRLDNGGIVVYTRVHNEGDVLHVGADDESTELPSTRTIAVDDLENAARAAVKQTAEIECEPTDIDQATILGIRDAADDSRETIYSLAIIVEATYKAGTVTGDATWQPSTTRRLTYA